MQRECLEDEHARVPAVLLPECTSIADGKSNSMNASSKLVPPASTFALSVWDAATAMSGLRTACCTLLQNREALRFESMVSS